jgi:peptide/nickel transport system ATP-binding protein/oligopeptide transport system ATP-binding protein
MDPGTPEPLLRVRDLAVEFSTDDGATVRAVDGVSFDVRPGEVLGIVGESGCGKSVTAMSILRLIPRPPGRYAGGQILYRGKDLLQQPINELRAVRGARISMIFQDPMQSLSPLHRIGTQLVETIQLHRAMPRAEAWDLGLSWLDRVGIPAARERMAAYPHELSGGMRQRVMIAMALMLEPEIVIADEPTTALDVTIQAQIFELMMRMKTNRTSVILITHDMGVIWELCDRMVVMYASRVVEEGTVQQVFGEPRHPYTQGLLASMPRVRAPGARLVSIPGQVPSPAAYPPGCHFADRCPRVFARCRAEKPPLFPLPDARSAACFLHAQKESP